MAEFDQAAFEAAVLKAAQTLDQQRAEKGRWLRNWIRDDPLPAARVIGTVCLILGVGFGWLAKAIIG